MAHENTLHTTVRIHIDRQASLQRPEGVGAWSRRRLRLLGQSNCRSRDTFPVAYSDMAIGLGLMLGFVFAKNFDSPYRATSITDFWRRWHISLSTWLREYLYIPLGGSRRGTVRTYANLLLTMLLGGLWHGASWNFVFWGGLHGSALAAERAFKWRRLHPPLPTVCRVTLTFLVVLIGWVFFRAPTLGAARAHLAAMLGLSAASPAASLLAGILYQPYYLLTLALAALVAFAGPQTWDFTRRLTWPKAALVLALFWISLSVLLTQTYNPFIYFIF